MISNSQLVSEINSGDNVMFFPSYGHLTKDLRTWKINVCGVVIDPENVGVYKRMLLRLLRRYLKATPEELEGEIFQERVRPFAAATDRGKRIAIQVGQRVYSMQKKSKRNGHFRGTLRLDVDFVEQLQAEGIIVDDQLSFRVAMPSGDHREFVSRAHLLGDTGVSVISDIDDTIKRTDVTSRQELLRNTFLREFESIDGMAGVYRQWESMGAVFHYVSSSPWQLYDPLAVLMQTDDFPQGTVHLRTFRLRDHMLRRLLMIRRRGKTSVVKKLVSSFPNRRFVLVGDSGERDPDIYGSVARKFPERIVGIFIRDLPQNPMSEERCSKAFHKISPRIWRTYTGSQDLAGHFPENM